MSDARFQDGGEAPLRLVARDGEDLKVISALVQDAVLPVTGLKFDARHRRFAAGNTLPDHRQPQSTP